MALIGSVALGTGVFAPAFTLLAESANFFLYGYSDGVILQFLALVSGPPASSSISTCGEYPKP